MRAIATVGTVLAPHPVTSSTIRPIAAHGHVLFQTIGTAGTATTTATVTCGVATGQSGDTAACSTLGSERAEKIEPVSPWAESWPIGISSSSAGTTRVIHVLRSPTRCSGSATITSRQTDRAIANHGLV